MPLGAPVRFWATAIAASIGAAGALALLAGGILRLEPRGAAILLTHAELWLLAVFCTGVIAILLGLSAEMGGWLAGGEARRGLERRLREAGVRGGREEPPEAGGPEPPSRGELSPVEEGAARWVMTMGAGLLALYLLGWWVVG